MMRSRSLLLSLLAPIAFAFVTASASRAVGAPASFATSAEQAQQAKASDDAPLPRKAGPLGLRLADAADGSVTIAGTQPDSPAARAGVESGFAIRAVNDRPIANRFELRLALGAVRAGERVRLSLQRAEEPVRTIEVEAEAAYETLPGSVVEYGSVRVPDGYRLRTIVTTPNASPLAKEGRHPAFLYVQGIVCDTIDRPRNPEAVDTSLVHAIANAGFVTMRVDKPGLGDSEGPPCSEIDLRMELDGYLAALRALAAMPSVDPDRIYVFGHSMGGVLAPFLAREVPVRGTIVYGTLVRTWFEYQLENVRRQSALRPGISASDITDAVLAEAKSSSMILIEKKTLGDVWARWPELRQPTQGIMLDENHMSTRSMAFFHQLQDLNIARAWEEASGAVLAIHGEFDWVTSESDHRAIVEIANARPKGRTTPAGTLLLRPKADHAFTTHPSLEASVDAMGQGAWDSKLPTEILAWIASVEANATASQEGVAPSPAPIPAPSPAPSPGPPPAQARAQSGEGLAMWERLPTEPYPGKQDDIVFANERVGWYGNGAGKLFRTDDGGDSWTKVWEQPGTFIRCLAFLDEKVGVLGNIGPGYFPGVTDAVPIYRTEDGGASWTAVTAIDGPPVVGLCAFEIVRVPFINAGTLDYRPRIVGVGRVGGPVAYIWSDDLGKTWMQGSLPSTAAMAFDITFVDERRGFIAAATSADIPNANGLILATDDGGSTWTEVHRSARPYETTWKFSFPSATVGYCTIQSYNPDPSASQRFVAKTEDGGRTWREIPLVDEHRVRAFGVAFLDADTGWIGAVPHGFLTVDGGATWTKAAFGNAVNKIRLLRVADGVTGYAIGTEVHRLRMQKP